MRAKSVREAGHKAGKKKTVAVGGTASGTDMPTWDAFYLGRLGRIDPQEGNLTAERADRLEGLTFGSAGDPLAGDIVEVTTDNRGGSPTALDQNNGAANDRFETDIGNGNRSFRFDAATSYEATITYTDGTTTTAVIVLFQATNGHTFIAPGLSGAANAPLIAAPIRSITLGDVVQNTATGLAIDREDDPFVPCFVKGSLILTPSGYRPVEDLKAGDIVNTLDHGPKPLVWVGKRLVPGFDRMAPIRIAKGALGNTRDLLVSPQHRMLVTGWRAELMFGEREVLVPAKSLVNGDTIHIQTMDQVWYHHIMFDGHEVVTAEGIATESFHPGKHMLDTDKDLRDEIVELFPELDDVESAEDWDTARPVLRNFEARLLS